MAFGNSTETRGRKPTYSNPEDMRAAINRYFDDCETKDCLPDYPGMVLSLKLKTKKALESYADPAKWLKRCGGDEKKAKELAEEYGDILEEAKLRRESYLVRIMASDNKRAQGCLNALKQPENGGYTDRPPENQEKVLKVQIGFGGWEAFK